MRNSLVETICKFAEKDKNIILMTGDLGFNVLDRFYFKFPDQFINAGISEQNMTSVAAGLALSGKCVFTYSIGSFTTLRCFEQIRNDICYHNANVKIISLAAGFAYGALGMSHHATEDIGCMKSLPNLTIFSPCDPLETIAVTKEAMRLKTPCYIRLGRGGEPNIHSEFNTDNFQLGKAYSVRQGMSKKFIIFATGAITAQAKRAADLLAERGVSIGVYSFPTIKPLDINFIKRCAKEYDTILTVEENNIYSGFGASVADILSTVRGNRAVIKKFGMNDEFSSIVGDTDYLRKYYKMDAAAIMEYILEENEK